MSFYGREGATITERMTLLSPYSKVTFDYQEGVTSSSRPITTISSMTFLCRIPLGTRLGSITARYL